MVKSKGKLAQLEEYVMGLKATTELLERKVKLKLVFDTDTVQKRIDALKPVIYRLSAILELE